MRIPIISTLRVCDNRSTESTFRSRTREASPARQKSRCAGHVQARPSSAAYLAGALEAELLLLRRGSLRRHRRPRTPPLSPCSLLRDLKKRQSPTRLRETRHSKSSTSQREHQPSATELPSQTTVKPLRQNVHLRVILNS